MRVDVSLVNFPRHPHEIAAWRVSTVANVLKVDEVQLYKSTRPKYT